MSETPKLRRSLSLTHIVLYGLGVTIGAGIYALLGEVVGKAGLLTPVAFTLALALVSFTALSFAEMVDRFPKSAGPAIYVHKGLNSKTLGIIVGLLVVASAIVSSAALVNGFLGYVLEFVEIPRTVAIVGLVCVLGLIVAWGIDESVGAAGLITAVEIFGLILVIGSGWQGFETLPSRWREFVPTADMGAWTGIFAGTLLAFYAFLGFEDIVSVAEEATDAHRILPLGIILTLVFTLVLYVGVSLAAVTNVPLDMLSTSQAPLAMIVEHTGAMPSGVISAIGMFAIINGALIQIIMASRILYGMSSMGWVPEFLARVHPTTQTPLIATALIVGGVLVLALGFRIAPLAEMTSMIALTVFSLVNLSLISLKWREPSPEGVRTYPLWVPIAGFIASAVFLLQEVLRRLS
ncbi:MAG: amino acid permease [Rhodospirillaceae bacterium]|jgi:basic amino acid/polyamine antiporter, APA family|nr:amino acid permease [Rhodospirillaceae bacterium]MBT5014521.1 amino acid permease [Rhodospirillaceae bacterium]MBT5308048.1 amino acid permease [Rhodospirillaceae bacterium]MBT6407243.1 amino acid permease [Rhodospirillaceae bacterium]MBT7354845.1 amino acid permease [Rhodospirillaceae bacterium]